MKTEMETFKGLSQPETEELAVKMAKQLSEKAVVVLTGELGTGKTTFSKALIKALGYGGSVTSPTYNYLNVYDGGDETRPLKIYHMDLYRFEEAEEFYQAGLGDYIGLKGGLSILEWGELVLDSLPENTIIVRFYYETEHTRTIEVKGIDLK